MTKPASLTKFIEHGGWHCGHCGRVALLSLDLDSPAKCPYCKKRTCEYFPPVKELAQDALTATAA